MNKMKNYDFPHGGNIWEAADRYGMRAEEIVDFSASINPWGNLLGIEDAIKGNIESIYRYPDSQCRHLVRMINEHFKIDYESVIVGNGATEIIYLLMRTLRPSIALIPAPTFSEYERALWLCGGEPQFFILKIDRNFSVDANELIERAKNVQVIVMCNPNNPTGSILPCEDVERIIYKAAQVETFVVIDESFIDFEPEFTVVQMVKRYQNLFVLRSFTKFYSIAGLRLGYGIGNRDLVAKMRFIQEPWTVNSLAQITGVHLLKNTDNSRQIREKIRKEKSFLYESLCQIKGLKPFPSHANFILVKVEPPLYVSTLVQKLAKSGILVRDCSNFRGLPEGFIRVAVRKREENEKLLQHLHGIMEGKR